MTGIYGMNFKSTEDGGSEYNMPELHTGAGYFVWWSVVGLISLSLLTYLKFVKDWM
jgi:Mg2+ and Co2+ transporter CorA